MLVTICQLARFIFCDASESVSSLLFCLRLPRNCAPALSVIQNVAVGRALPEFFHHPQWSLSKTTTGRWGTRGAHTALASTSPHCGSGRWCSRPPSLQFRLGWSSFRQSNLDLPHGKGRGGEKHRKKGMRTTRNGWSPPESISIWRGGGLTQGACGELGESEQDVQIFSQACTDGLVFATLKRFC